MAKYPLTYNGIDLLIVSLQFITERIATGSGSVILHTELIRQAAIVGRIDEEILRSKA